ncbi:MAG: DUF983 domain-containing protein [Acetobacteraceae bacterium]|nr:DUF983 domain-containing protein [Acetobacteraceae bacterium]
MRWSPPPSHAAPPYVVPPLGLAVRRGVANRCPVCGGGRIFAGYLTVVQSCVACGAPLGRLRADDAPPYFTILLTGHILVPGVLWVEKAYMPPMWLHMVVWLPLFTIVCMLLLRPIKGAVVGWMVRLGFTGDEHAPDSGQPLAPARAPARGADRDG